MPAESDDAPAADAGAADNRRASSNAGAREENGVVQATQSAPTPVVALSMARTTQAAAVVVTSSPIALMATATADFAAPAFANVSPTVVKPTPLLSTVPSQVSVASGVNHSLAQALPVAPAQPGAPPQPVAPAQPVIPPPPSARATTTAAGSIVAAATTTSIATPIAMTATAKPAATAIAIAKPTATATAIAKPTAAAIFKPPVAAIVKPPTAAVVKPTAIVIAKPAATVIAKPAATVMAKPTADVLVKPTATVVSAPMVQATLRRPSTVASVSVAQAPQVVALSPVSKTPADVHANASPAAMQHPLNVAQVSIAQAPEAAVAIPATSPQASSVVETGVAEAVGVQASSVVVQPQELRLPASKMEPVLGSTPVIAKPSPSAPITTAAASTAIAPQSTPVAHPIAAAFSAPAFIPAAPLPATFTTCPAVLPMSTIPAAAIPPPHAVQAIAAADAVKGSQPQRAAVPVQVPAVSAQVVQVPGSKMQPVLAANAAQSHLPVAAAAPLTAPIPRQPGSSVAAPQNAAAQIPIPAASLSTPFAAGPAPQVAVSEAEPVLLQKPVAKATAVVAQSTIAAVSSSIPALLQQFAVPVSAPVNIIPSSAPAVPAAAMPAPQAVQAVAAASAVNGLQPISVVARDSFSTPPRQQPAAAKLHAPTPVRPIPPPAPAFVAPTSTASPAVVAPISQSPAPVVPSRPVSRSTPMCNHPGCRFNPNTPPPNRVIRRTPSPAPYSPANGASPIPSPGHSHISAQIRNSGPHSHILASSLPACCRALLPPCCIKAGMAPARLVQARLKFTSPRVSPARPSASHSRVGTPTHTPPPRVLAQSGLSAAGLAKALASAAVPQAISSPAAAMLPKQGLTTAAPVAALTGKSLAPGSAPQQVQHIQQSVSAATPISRAPTPGRPPVAPVQALSTPIALSKAQPLLSQAGQAAATHLQQARNKPVFTIQIPVSKVVADAAAAAAVATAAGIAADEAARVAAVANAKSAALAAVIASNKHFPGPSNTLPAQAQAIQRTLNAAVPPPQSLTAPPPVNAAIQKPSAPVGSLAPSVLALGQSAVSNGLRSKPLDLASKPVLSSAGSGFGGAKASPSDEAMIDDELTTELPALPAPVHVDADGTVTIPTAQTSATAAGAAAGALILAPAFEFGDNEHVTIWNRIECRKIAGNAAPLGRNVYKYLDQHADCEVYYNQDKAGPGERSAKKKRLLEGDAIFAGDHVPIWNRRLRRKIAGNAAPLHKNLDAYLAKRPDCERYTFQDSNLKPGEGSRRKAADKEAGGGSSVEDGLTMVGSNLFDAGAVGGANGTSSGNDVADFMSNAVDDLHHGPAGGSVLPEGVDVSPMDLNSDNLLGAPIGLDTSLAGNGVDIDRMLSSPEPIGNKLDTSDWAHFSDALELPAGQAKLEMESAADFFLNMDMPKGDEDGDISLAILTGPEGEVLDGSPLANLDLNLLSGDADDDDLGIDVMPSNNFASAPDLVF